MPLALTSPTTPVVTYCGVDLEPLLEAARESPRRRMIQPVQRAETAPVQRLLNALQPGTYIRPHRHPLPGASETIVLLRGRLAVRIYTADGTLLSQHRLGPGDLIDIEPGVWHGMVCLAPDTVIAEFKNGPYNPEQDKEFAPWAP